jgi:phosphatidylserine/phosphatidylglycerophosphate/cardiolipin synthase-like enzyme
MLDALCLAGKKGVDVRLITPHIPDKRTVFWMTRSNYKVPKDRPVMRGWQRIIVEVAKVFFPMF